MAAWEKTLELLKVSVDIAGIYLNLRPTVIFHLFDVLLGLKLFIYHLCKWIFLNIVDFFFADRKFGTIFRLGCEHNIIEKVIIAVISCLKWFREIYVEYW